jgi:4-hydroxybenzoyl-CoA reductase subunit beta
VLRLPEFRFQAAGDPADAVARYADSENAVFLAGGTDLLPNMKHHLLAPRDVIGLTGALGREITVTDTHFRIDAGVSLHLLSNHPQLKTEMPALAQSASVVAGPQIRRMGTIGGNVLLDTRCLYLNQTQFWRQALGYCLKAEGTWCHVIGGPKTCVAAQSADTVPVLLTLDAAIELLGPGGLRTVALRSLYRFDGVNHLKLDKGEVLTTVVVPRPGPGHRASYQKLRTRDSIDFPQLGLAVATWWDGPALTKLEIVVGAANPQPKPVRKLDQFLGGPLTADAIERIAQLVQKQTRPNTAVHGSVDWRRSMAKVFARRALTELATG